VTTFASPASIVPIAVPLAAVVSAMSRQVPAMVAAVFAWMTISVVETGSGVGGGGAVGSGAAGSGSTTVSCFVGPGAAVRYRAGDSTIWSSEMPSSRCWMRMVCGPVAAKYTSGPSTPVP
jgi:hypothetical protein